MMRPVFQAALITLWIAGCQLKLEAPILPNVDLRNLPLKSDPTKVDTASDNTPKSQGVQKTVFAKLIISDDVASKLEISKTDNCVQLVELSSKVVVVDFGAGACPAAATEAIADANLKFTALYENVRRDTYLLTFRGKEIGEMSLSIDGNQMTLKSLCTNRYTYYCHQSVVQKLLAGPPVTY